MSCFGVCCVRYFKTGYTSCLDGDCGVVGVFGVFDGAVGVFGAFDGEVLRVGVAGWPLLNDEMGV